jgi:DNA-directed RNA polymerase specialized sigma24 family protein
MRSRRFSSHILPPDPELEQLARRSVAGDRRGWHGFWCAVDPFFDSVAGRWRLTGVLAAREDERRNIVVRALGLLHEDGFRRLRDLLALLEERAGSPRAWLSVFAANTAVSYVRAHGDNLAAGDAAPRWATFLPLTEEIQEHLPASLRAHAAAEARLLAARAAERLREDQRQAVALWLTAHSFAEIAAALGLPDAGAAERLVRAAVALLRKVPWEER